MNKLRKGQILNKINSIISIFVGILFVLISGFLFLLSIFNHCEANIHSVFQEKTIVNHSFILYGSIALFFLLIFVSLYILVRRICVYNDLIPKLSIIIPVILIMLLSLFWINFSKLPPRLDQFDVFEEAQKIAGFSSEPHNFAYFGNFKRQRSTALFMALLLKLFGNSPLGFQLYNTFMSALLIIGASKLLYTIVSHFKPNMEAFVSQTILINVMLLAFYPITVYTCFLYGTVSAVTCEIWGFYAILCLQKESEHPNPRLHIIYTLLTALSFSWGAHMHQSALIGLLAGCVFILLKILFTLTDATHDKSKRTYITELVVTLFCIVFVYACSTMIVDTVFEHTTGSPKYESLPASAGIYMGLTADESNPGGPGSQDGSQSQIFEDCDFDPQLTNQVVWEEIKTQFHEYVTGERSLSFFVKKIEYQWLDPSIDTHKLIYLTPELYGPENNPSPYGRFYYSSLRKNIFHLGISYQILVYGLCLFTGIWSLIKSRHLNPHILIHIFVIGGFVFQLFWESTSRYVASYYILLIVEAAYGLCVIGDLIYQQLNARMPKLFKSY